MFAPRGRCQCYPAAPNPPRWGFAGTWLLLLVTKRQCPRLKNKVAATCGSSQWFGRRASGSSAQMDHSSLPNDGFNGGRQHSCPGSRNGEGPQTMCLQLTCLVKGGPQNPSVYWAAKILLPALSLSTSF